jgi:hypothetical protein
LQQIYTCTIIFTSTPIFGPTHLTVIYTGTWDRRFIITLWIWNLYVCLRSFSFCNTVSFWVISRRSNIRSRNIWNRNTHHSRNFIVGNILIGNANLIIGLILAGITNERYGNTTWTIFLGAIISIFIMIRILTAVSFLLIYLTWSTLTSSLYISITYSGSLEETYFNFLTIINYQFLFSISILGLSRLSVSLLLSIQVIIKMLLWLEISLLLSICNLILAEMYYWIVCVSVLLCLPQEIIGISLSC